jgi:CheY-like chemotaxis protein
MKSKKRQKYSVVVAEKNSENRLSMCSLVASLNLEAMPTCSGLDTIREVTRGQVALVLLDVDLALPDGKSILYEIRKVAPKLPVIMMSSAMTSTLARRLTDRGAQGFLLKPVQRAHLAMMLFQYLPG